VFVTSPVCCFLTKQEYYARHLTAKIAIQKLRKLILHSDLEKTSSLPMTLNVTKGTVSTLVEGCSLFMLDNKNQRVFRLFYDNEDKCVCCVVIFMNRIIFQTTRQSMKQFNNSEYIYQYIIIVFLPQRATRLVEALRYKPECSGFDSRW